MNGPQIKKLWTFSPVLQIPTRRPGTILAAKIVDCKDFVWSRNFLAVKKVGCKKCLGYVYCLGEEGIQHRR